jgi:hypothetical protein
MTPSTNAAGIIQSPSEYRKSNGQLVFSRSMRSPGQAQVLEYLSQLTENLFATFLASVKHSTKVFDLSILPM